MHAGSDIATQVRHGPGPQDHTGIGASGQTGQIIMIAQYEFVRRCTIIYTRRISKCVRIIIESAIDDGIPWASQHWSGVIHHRDELGAGLDISTRILGGPGAEDQASAIATGELGIVTVRDGWIGRTVVKCCSGSCGGRSG